MFKSVGGVEGFGMGIGMMWKKMKESRCICSITSSRDVQKRRKS